MARGRRRGDPHRYAAFQACSWCLMFPLTFVVANHHDWPDERPSLTKPAQVGWSVLLSVQNMPSFLMGALLIMAAGLPSIIRCFRWGKLCPCFEIWTLVSRAALLTHQQNPSYPGHALWLSVLTHFELCLGVRTNASKFASALPVMSVAPTTQDATFRWTTLTQSEVRNKVTTFVGRTFRDASVPAPDPICCDCQRCDFTSSTMHAEVH
jgi:hypothetical protein